MGAKQTATAKERDQSHHGNQDAFPGSKFRVELILLSRQFLFKVLIIVA
jgi:hypothetical protein